MESNRRLWRWNCIIFAVFLIVGTAAANLSGKEEAGSWQLYFMQVGELLNRQDFARESYFFYILKLRLTETGVLWLLSMTSLGKAGLWGSIGWLGFLCGVRISLGTMVFGRKGLLYFLCSIMPQVIFYIPALLLLYGRGFHICSFMKSQRDWGQYRRIRMGKDILICIIMLLFLLPGMICECYINPLILKAYF